MENAQLISLSRQMALQRQMDVVANNLANINTTGFKGEQMPAASIRCGKRYTPIARAYARGLSGTHWTLYELQP